MLGTQSLEDALGSMALLLRALRIIMQDLLDDSYIRICWMTPISGSAG
jgi:hypothetical protein